MPRILEELPRHGHTYYLDVPRRTDDSQKSKRLRSFTKHGDIYEGPRPKQRPLPRRGDILKYQVWCSICMDAGCDQCPPYANDKE